ncbi:MAG TPA: T9SS type A sorting domain-containing protein, partial [bacterium]
AVVVLNDSRGYGAQRINDYLAVDQAAASPQTGEKLCLSISPNPFNPRTTFSFDLPEAGLVNLAIYDISGRLLATLVSGYRDAGSHSVDFDGTNLVSGIYIYRLNASSFDATGKIVLMK